MKLIEMINEIFENRYISEEWEKFKAYANNPETYNRKVETPGDGEVFLKSLSFDELREVSEEFLPGQNEYKTAANFILDKMGVTMKTKFLFYGLHSEDDKDKRNIYSIVFERKDRAPLVVPKFGQSVVNSSQYMGPRNTYFKDRVEAIKSGYSLFGKEIKKNPNFGPPTAYDVLACLTKYDPWDFKDFCSEYGYSDDSIKAKNTYEAVREEWNSVRKFFTEKEIEQLQEIA